MPKRLLIYDVDESFQGVFLRQKERDLLFSASPQVRHCIGCFGCWIKTPGRCVIQDRCAVMPSYLAQANEVVIVSPMVYGGYSPNVKAVLDRSIGYLLPYFRIISHEMHHRMRVQNPFALNVYFYGECNEAERRVAGRLVQANAVNFGAGSYSVHFNDSIDEITEVLF